MPTKVEEFRTASWRRFLAYKDEEVARLQAELRQSGLTGLAQVSNYQGGNDKDLVFVFRRRDGVVGSVWFSVRARQPKFYFYMPGCKVIRATRNSFERAAQFMQTNQLLDIGDNQLGTAGYCHNAEWRDW